MQGHQNSTSRTATASRDREPLANRPDEDKKPGKDESASPIRSFGVLCLLLFLFFSYSRLLELLNVGFRIPFTLSLVALGGLVLSGGLRTALRSPTARLWLGFTAWLLIATPFSYWRGGSIEVLTDQWSKSLSVFFLVAGLITTLRDCRRTMFALALAGLALAIEASLWGVASIEGRLTLETGTFNNPNEIGIVLVTMLPLVWFLLATHRNLVIRLAGFAGTLLIFKALLATGSRAAFIALVGMAAYLMLRFSPARRVKYALGLGALAALLLASAPELIIDRLATTFGPPAALDQDSELIGALDSTEQRLYLLEQSIKLTLANPLVGVGPGQFQTVLAEQEEQEDVLPSWRATHNSYTQVSSEAGLIAFFFYCAIVAASLKGMHRTYGRLALAGHTEVANLVLAFSLSLLGYCISCIFASLAYHFYLPSLTGLAVAVAGATESLSRLNTPTQIGSTSVHPVGLPPDHRLRPL